MSPTTLFTALFALPARATPPPSPTPSSTTPAGCVPGRDGVPHNLLGHLMCGDYLTRAPHTAWSLVHEWWPLLLAVTLALAVAWGGWALLRRRAWRQTVAAAVWLEIVPPVSATPAATYALWHLLSTMLPVSRRCTLRPHRLLWEVHATPNGMRCGLWVPPGINPTAVLRALQRAWPGVRAEHARPPTVAPHRPAFGVRLRPTLPEWLPLVEDADPVATSRFATVPEADRIRAVFDGLAAAGRTGAGMLQIHVARAPRRRVALLRKASVDPRRARHHRTSARLLILAGHGLHALISWVLDLVTPGSGSGSRHYAALDPVLAEQSRQARARHAAGPHLLVAVHATATGPTMAAARAAAADITSGYSLLSPHWRPHRLRHPATAATYRWEPELRMHLATVAEVAALAGLPAEPASHGLPAAASRRLPPSRDIFTPTTSSHPNRPPTQHRRDTRDDDPAPRSTS